ncbi:MAG: hypothetical protein KBD06_04455 [Candidatus Pacebacteria bacterium]|nr:hypothetical protein [Candidatus Paceibacterota bacterium]
MRYTFSAPTSLHRYQAWWMYEGQIVSAQNSFEPKQLVDFEDLSIVELEGVEEIAVRVQFEGTEFYVLAKEINPCIGVLCELWKASRQKGNTGEFCFEQVEHAVRKHVRAKLHLVGS